MKTITTFKVPISFGVHRIEVPFNSQFLSANLGEYIYLFVACDLSRHLVLQSIYVLETDVPVDDAIQKGTKRHIATLRDLNGKFFHVLEGRVAEVHGGVLKTNG